MGCGASTSAIGSQQKAALWFAGDANRYHAIQLSSRIAHSEHPEKIAAECAKIEHLRFAALPKWSTDIIALSTLACPNARSLSIKQAPFTGDGPAVSGDKVDDPFRKCGQHARRLTHIEIVNCRAMDGTAFLSFFDALPNTGAIKSLSLQGCLGVNDEAITVLASRDLSNLKAINLNDCVEVTGTSLAKLVAACPNIEEFHIAQTKVNGKLFAAMTALKLHDLQTFTLGDADISEEEDVKQFLEMMRWYKGQLIRFLASSDTTLAKAFVSAHGPRPSR